VKRLLGALALAAALVGGCGDDAEEPPAARAEQPPPPAPAPPPPPKLRPARCPADVTGCRVATGRIIYVERVDPDGDGDAHFVLASRASITAPGISAVDVRGGLRPKPLPDVGDRLSAAGPVQTGSHGQRQVHALRLRVAR
jgi:hypothetical protein